MNFDSIEGLTDEEISELYDFSSIQLSGWNLCHHGTCRSNGRYCVMNGNGSYQPWPAGYYYPSYGCRVIYVSYDSSARQNCPHDTPC